MIPSTKVAHADPPPRAGWRPDVRDLALLVVVSLSLVFAHRQALAGLVASWNASPMYSYGFTVPFISAYLLWTRRAELQRLTPRPAWMSGGVLALIAALTTVAARTAGMPVLEQLAFLVSLTAGVLILFGWAYVKVSWAALAYLLLMIPIWDGLTEGLHEPFQHRSAAIGVWLLQLASLPVYREGTVIALPNVTLEVARACSGVNYLVAVVALGLPMAYVYLPGIWRRVTLLLAAVVVAALSNGLRVALIGVLAYYELGSPLHGPFHMLHGLFVAGIGYVVLFVGLRVLTPRPTSSEKGPAFDVRRPALASRRMVSWPRALALVAVFMVLGMNLLARTPEAVALNADVSAFPMRLGEWKANAERLPPQDPETSLWPGADVEFRRRFARDDGAVVDLYVGYFASQQPNKQMVSYIATAIHNHATPVTVSGARGSSFAANLATPQGARPEMLFWYEISGGVESNRFAVKAKTLWRSAVEGHSNGSVVVLVSRAVGRGSAGQALRELAPQVHEVLAGEPFQSARGER